MKFFLGLTSLINIAIIAATLDPSMKGFAAGGFDQLPGLEKVGWMIVIALPIIAAAGAVLPWFLQANRTLAIFLALLPAAILGTTIYAAQVGLIG